MPELKQRIYPLKGKVQHYSWGGHGFIPELLEINNEILKPYAEYWLGAHPIFPSTIQADGTELLLNDFIEAHKADVLGNETAETFGRLPFLLKVLDVHQMLSIQVHPEKEAAMLAFEEENKKRIPLTAAHRNYKDDNHKPELMVALGDFWLLHGFRPAKELSQLLREVPELSFLENHFNGDYEHLYRYVMTMSQPEADSLLEPLVNRILPLYEAGQLQKHLPDFWAARAAKIFCKNNYDRGLFSIYFFNLLHLRKGEGIYQPAGLPHAYLEGQNIEIMANSDNVLRAGLTDKHIDVNELLKHARFQETIPAVLSASNEVVSFYPAPVSEFELYQYRMDKGSEKNVVAGSAEIWLVMEGAVAINKQGVKKGEAAFILSGTPLVIKASADAILFRAGVPSLKNR